MWEAIPDTHDPRGGGGWKWARAGEKRNWYFA